MTIFELLSQNIPHEFEQRKAAILELISADQKVIHEKSQDKLQNTPLHIAAEQNDLVLVNFLSEKGAVLDVKNADGITPYQCALKADAKSSVAQFLAKKLNYSPLHIAAIKNDVKEIRFLRKNGAQLEVLTSTDKTPFECALDAKSVEACELYAKWKVDIERPRKDRTLLHSAILEKDFLRTKFLLELGANCFACFAYIGEDILATPIQLVARLRLSEEWWQLLFSYGAGILCRIDDETLDPTTLPLEKITPDMFFFSFTFKYGNHLSRITKKTKNCENGCFGITDLIESIKQGKPHNLKAYIRTVKNINKDVPDAPPFLTLLTQLQDLKKAEQGLSPKGKKIKSLTKLVIRHILLAPQSSSNVTSQQSTATDTDEITRRLAGLSSKIEADDLKEVIKEAAEKLKKKSGIK